MEYRHGSHSLYDLKYHMVFCTKYRYRILTGQIATRTRELIREVCAVNYAVTVGNVNEEEIQRYIEQQEVHHKKDDFRISEF